MFTVDYFINKFEAIPEEKWTKGSLYTDGRCCAQGHCGARNGDNLRITEGTEVFCLLHLFGKHFESSVGHFALCVAGINNGLNQRYLQPTPKQRILAALYDIKKMQQPAYTDITKSLAILPEDKIETDLPVKELNHV